MSKAVPFSYKKVKFRDKKPLELNIAYLKFFNPKMEELLLVHIITILVACGQ